MPRTPKPPEGEDPVVPETTEVMPPGIDTSDPEPDLTELTVPQLEAKAEKRGVDVEGTGAGGNVLKGDLVQALEDAPVDELQAVGLMPAAVVAEAAAVAAEAAATPFIPAPVED